MMETSSHILGDSTENHVCASVSLELIEFSVCLSESNWNLLSAWLSVGCDTGYESCGLPSVICEQALKRHKSTLTLFLSAAYLFRAWVLRVIALNTCILSVN